MLLFDGISITEVLETLPTRYPPDRTLPAKLFTVTGIEEVFWIETLNSKTGMDPIKENECIVPGKNVSVETLRILLKANKA